MLAVKEKRIVSAGIIGTTLLTVLFVLVIWRAVEKRNLEKALRLFMTESSKSQIELEVNVRSSLEMACKEGWSPWHFRNLTGQLNKFMAEDVAFDRDQARKSAIMDDFKWQQDEERERVGNLLSGDEYSKFLDRQVAEYKTKLGEVYGNDER